MDAVHCERCARARAGVIVGGSTDFPSMLFVEAENTRGRVTPLDPGVGNAVQILAGREIRGQERWHLVPRRVLLVVFGPGRAIHFC